MHFLFQKRALLRDECGEAPDQLFPLIVSRETIRQHEYGDFASGWIPYSGVLDRSCYCSRNTLSLHAQSRPVHQVFLAVLLQSGSRKHDGWVIQDTVTNRAGGHVLVEPGDNLYALLDAYRHACGAEFTTDPTATEAFLPWKVQHPD